MHNSRNDPDPKYRPRLSRRTFLRGSATALAATGGSALLSSCGGGGAQSSAGGGQTSGGKIAVTFLTVLPLTSLTFSPELLADAGGYFADNGLDVTFQTSRGSAQAIQLVLAGSAGLTRIGQIEGMEAAANRGAPIANVGTVIKESTIRYVSSRQEPLQKPQDFVGKTIGIPSEGGTSETTLDLVLSTNGIDPKQVKRQVVGLSPGVFNLVKKGRLAGYAVSIDTAKILQQQRSGVAVFRPGEFMTSGAQFYMTSQDSLKQDKKTIGKYIESVYAALEFMVNDENHEKTLEIMRKKYSFDTLKNTSIAKASLDEYVRVWTSAGKENILKTLPENWSKGYKELASVGQAESGANPDEWFTNTLVPAS